MGSHISNGRLSHVKIFINLTFQPMFSSFFFFSFFLLQICKNIRSYISLTMQSTLR